MFKIPYTVLQICIMAFMEISCKLADRYNFAITSNQNAQKFAFYLSFTGIYSML